MMTISQLTHPPADPSTTHPPSRPPPCAHTKRESLASQLSAASLGRATLTSSVLDADARLRRAHRATLNARQTGLELATRFAHGALDKLARLEARLSAVDARIAATGRAMRRLVREHWAMRAQRRASTGVVGYAEECVFLRVEIATGEAALELMRREMASVSRIDD